MSTKTYCDSCGKEMTKGVVLVGIPLQEGGNVQACATLSSLVDVCETCVCKAFAQKLSRAELTSLAPPMPWVPVDEHPPIAWPSQHEEPIMRAGDPPKKLVSRNTTIAMREAADTLKTKHTTRTFEYWEDVWKAMFDAA